jgi:hypothetical protein
MQVQLVLIDETPADWRLDEGAREVGRRGLAEARAALQAAARKATEKQAA